MRRFLIALAILSAGPASAQIQPGEAAPEPTLARQELGTWKAPVGWVSPDLLLLSEPSPMEYGQSRIRFWTRKTGVISTGVPFDAGLDLNSTCISGKEVRWLALPPRPARGAPQQASRPGRTMMHFTVDPETAATSLTAGERVNVQFAPFEYRIVLDDPAASLPLPAVFTMNGECRPVDPAAAFAALKAAPLFKDVAAVSLRLDYYSGDGFIAMPESRADAGQAGFKPLDGYPQYVLSSTFTPIDPQPARMRSTSPPQTPLGHIEIVDLAREPDPVRAQAQLVAPSGKRVGLKTAQPGMTFNVGLSPDGCIALLREDTGYRQPVVRQYMGRFGSASTLTLIDLCDASNRAAIEAAG